MMNRRDVIRSGAGGPLLTDVHRPEATRLRLVGAFAGREAVLAAYRHAVEQRYRFFSYGDAMFITPTASAREVRS